jgi:amino acid permease
VLFLHLFFSRVEDKRMLNKYFKYLYKSLSFCFSSITIKQQIFSISKEEKKKKPQAVSSIDASGDEVVM